MSLTYRITWRSNWIRPVSHHISRGYELNYTSSFSIYDPKNSLSILFMALCGTRNSSKAGGGFNFVHTSIKLSQTEKSHKWLFF